MPSVPVISGLSSLCFVLLLLLEPAGKPATSASSRPDTELHKLLASPQVCLRGGDQSF